MLMMNSSLSSELELLSLRGGTSLLSSADSSDRPAPDINGKEIEGLWD